MKLSPKSVVLLVSSVIAATLLIFHAHEGHHRPREEETAPYIASRNLMSRNAIEPGQVLVPADTPAVQDASPFTSSSLRALLQNPPPNLCAKQRLRMAAPLQLIQSRR